MGRPSKCTPELIEQLVPFVVDGLYIEAAAALVEVDQTSIDRYLRLGREESDDGPHRAFYLAIKRAEATADYDDLCAVKRGGEGWQARAWRLERRRPRRYGLRVKESVREAQVEMLDAAKRVLEPAVYERLLAAIEGKEDGQ